MKINATILTLAFALPTAMSAQDSIAVSNSDYPNTYSSGSANVYPFTQDSKRFNDWSISVGAGVPLLQHGELNSLKKDNDAHGDNVVGYSAYVSIDKAITHAFGLKLQYDKGETRQGWFNTKTGAYKLGATNNTAVQSDTWVIHLLCQDEELKTNVKALEECLNKVCASAKFEKASVHVSTLLTDNIPELSGLLTKTLLDKGVSVYFYEEP